MGGGTVESQAAPIDDIGLGGERSIVIIGRADGAPRGTNCCMFKLAELEARLVSDDATAGVPAEEPPRPGKRA